MGYYTRFSGFISCEPQVQWLRYKDLDVQLSSLRLVEEEDVIETEDGPLTKKKASKASSLRMRIR